MPYWFIQVFSQYTVSWLVITAGVGLLSGFLSTLIAFYFKNKEKKLETEKEKQERLRMEIVRWANPIFGAVSAIIRRLNNILDKDGYKALSAQYDPLENPDWSITYDYFMNSTLFLFSQYFAWIRMFEEELNFELFQTPKAHEKFFSAVGGIVKALGDYPLLLTESSGHRADHVPALSPGELPPDNDLCCCKDSQVFALQQRAIGELLIVRDKETKSTISYPEFIKKIKTKDPEFNDHMEPLKMLLDDLTPGKDGALLPGQIETCRWRRLQVTRQRLLLLENECKELLSIKENG